MCNIPLFTSQSPQYIKQQFKTFYFVNPLVIWRLLPQLSIISHFPLAADCVFESSDLRHINLINSFIHKNCVKTQFKVPIRFINKLVSQIHSFIQTISILSLQVLYYSEALPTQHGYCIGISRRSATGKYEWKTCPRSPCSGLSGSRTHDPSDERCWLYQSATMPHCPYKTQRF